MRQFRRDSKNFLNNGQDEIFYLGDNYRLNMYRDLLFHVQKHQFTLPQIKNALDGLNLEFLEMIVQEPMLQRYRQMFPDTSKGQALDNWDKVEAANPDMFKSMYQFWCRKKHS